MPDMLSYTRSICKWTLVWWKAKTLWNHIAMRWMTHVPHVTGIQLRIHNDQKKRLWLSEYRSLAKLNSASFHWKYWYVPGPDARLNKENGKRKWPLGSAWMDIRGNCSSTAVNCCVTNTLLVNIWFHTHFSCCTRLTSTPVGVRWMQHGSACGGNDGSAIHVFHGLCSNVTLAWVRLAYKIIDKAVKCCLLIILR